MARIRSKSISGDPPCSADPEGKGAWECAWQGGEAEAEARDPQEAAPLLRGPIYIFNIYCFLLIEQEEEVEGRLLITPPPHLFLSS